MAVVVSETLVRRGAPTKYDWDAWLDGRCWLLVRGADYTCTTMAMQNGARRHGKLRGFVVCTRAHERGLVIQAIRGTPADK